jgi:hypothetical protein
MDWSCGGVGVLPILGSFSCKVFSSVSPRFYFRKHAFCFLPLVAILESPKIFPCIYVLYPELVHLFYFSPLEGAIASCYGKNTVGTLGLKDSAQPIQLETKLPGNQLLSNACISCLF